jgi:hypothetical protein
VTLDGALWNVTEFKGANSNLCLYLALFFRGIGSAFSGTLANTRLVKKCGRVSSRTFVSPEQLMKCTSSVFLDV